MKSTRLSKEEAISFLLTHIVVERRIDFEMNQANLFAIINLAAQAEAKLGREEGLIPHEVIEELAAEFIAQQSQGAK